MEPIRVVAARQGLRKLVRIPYPIEELRLTKLQEQPEGKTTERGTATFIFPASPQHKSGSALLKPGGQSRFAAFRT